MPDYPGAIEMLVPDSIVFPNSGGYTRKWLVLHRTAGGSTATGLASYFRSGADGRNASVHYVVGLDGVVVQCVRERDGAGGNCCLEQGHDSFWPTNINLNLVTFSIECVDPTTDNSTVMPDKQKAALFALVKDICTRNSIPMRAADATGGIAGHCSISPISRQRCPGLDYPWAELWAYLQKGVPMIPIGWHDDGHSTLTAPNGLRVVRGFRDFILSHSWDPANWPLEEEVAATPLEESNPALGAGTRQTFRMSMLEWTPARGVFVAWVGQELQKLREIVTNAHLN